MADLVKETTATVQSVGTEATSNVVAAPQVAPKVLLKKKKEEPQVPTTAVVTERETEEGLTEAQMAELSRKESEYESAKALIFSENFQEFTTVGSRASKNRGKSRHGRDEDGAELLRNLTLEGDQSGRARSDVEMDSHLYRRATYEQLQAAAAMKASILQHQMMLQQQQAAYTQMQLQLQMPQSQPQPSQYQGPLSNVQQAMNRAPILTDSRYAAAANGTTPESMLRAPIEGDPRIRFVGDELSNPQQSPLIGSQLPFLKNPNPAVGEYYALQQQSQQQQLSSLAYQQFPQPPARGRGWAPKANARTFVPKEAPPKPPSFAAVVAVSADQDKSDPLKKD